MALKMNKRIEDGLKKYSLPELICMVGLSCVRQQHSKEGCRGCAFITDEDECNLMGMAADTAPDEWIDYYVGREHD